MSIFRCINRHDTKKTSQAQATGVDNMKYSDWYFIRTEAHEATNK